MRRTQGKGKNDENEEGRAPIPLPVVGLAEQRSNICQNKQIAGYLERLVQYAASKNAP